MNARARHMESLVQRLRDKAFNFSADPILDEAADEIERLQTTLDDVCEHRDRLLGDRDETSV